MPRKAVHLPSPPPHHPMSLCQKESDTRTRRSRECKLWSPTELRMSARAETSSPDHAPPQRSSPRPTIRQTKKTPTQLQFPAPEPVAKLPDAARQMAQNSTRPPAETRWPKISESRAREISATLSSAEIQHSSSR